MNNKNWYDEVKENSIKNINDSYTLNLAVSVLEDRKELLNENLKLQQELQQKEDIIYKIKKCIEEKEEYYGDYMGDGNYTMYSMMGANNNRIPYIKSNLIKQILDNKGE